MTETLTEIAERIQAATTPDEARAAAGALLDYAAETPALEPETRRNWLVKAARVIDPRCPASEPYAVRTLRLP